MTSAEANRRAPVRVVGVQVVAAAIAAAVAAMWGADAAKAAFLGGAVAFLPNAYFAWAAGRRTVAGRAYAEAGRLLGRWGVKLALAMALLVFALAVADVGGGAFFAGLGVALAAQFAAPLVARGR